MLKKNKSDLIPYACGIKVKEVKIEMTIKGGLNKKQKKKKKILRCRNNSNIKYQNCRNKQNRIAQHTNTWYMISQLKTRLI